MPNKWAFDFAEILANLEIGKAAVGMEWVARHYRSTVEVQANGKIFHTNNASWFYVAERTPLMPTAIPTGSNRADDSQEDIRKMRNAVTVVVDKINASWFDPIFRTAARIPWTALSLCMRDDQKIRLMLGLSNGVLVKREKYPLLPHRSLLSYTFYCLAVHEMVPSSLELPPGFN
jgi:hypothetical protein